MQTDGRTDMTKLIIALRNFANAPKKGNISAKKLTKGVCMCVYVCIYIYIYMKNIVT